MRLGSLDSPETRNLLSTDSKALYASSWLSLIHAGTDADRLESFDPSRAELKGDSFPVAEEVRVGVTNGRAAFSVSESGVLTYRSGAESQVNQLTWLDQSGKVLQTIDQPNDYRSFALSPDDSQIIVHRHEGPGGGGLWLIDWKRGTKSRFTSSPSHNTDAHWSPDGGRIAVQIES